MSAQAPTAPGLPGRVSGLRTLTNKVALLFAGVVLLAFGVVYFYIVPALESSLREQVMEDLADQARTSTGEIEDVIFGAAGTPEGSAPEIDAAVGRTASVTDARVTLLGISRRDDGSGCYYQISDSSMRRPPAPIPETTPPVVQPTCATPGVAELGVTLSVADAGADAVRPRSGLGRNDGELVAQAAVPILAEGAALGSCEPNSGSRRCRPVFVAVYSRPLDTVGEAVGLIQRQVLVAGALAMLVALAGGWLVARAVARRVRRLETAADAVARGRSVEPLPVDSEDELGQLTRTFNEMQRQLARTERSRREFIANASHELRTPIFSLGGFAELLQDEDLDPETREHFLASMREQIDRLQRLAADLLDLSRLDAGALEIHRRESNLAEVAEAVSSEFRPAVADRGDLLTVHLPRRGLFAWCDPDRVAQIIRILLDNALRHNPDGTRVTVSAARRGGSVELTVSDSGAGIAPDAAEHVFERFYTADAARGSGLGLAIARQLARRMGGDLRLRTSPGRTAFTLVLPATTAAGGNGRPADDAAPTSATAVSA